MRLRKAFLISLLAASIMMPSPDGFAAPSSHDRHQTKTRVKAKAAPQKPAADIAALKAASRLIDQNRYDAAEQKLKNLVNREKNNAEAWTLLGFVYRQTERFDQAAEAYQMALTADPDHKHALVKQADLFMLQGLPERAEENMARLVTLCPYGCSELEDLQRLVVFYAR